MWMKGLQSDGEAQFYVVATKRPVTGAILVADDPA